MKKVKLLYSRKPGKISIDNFDEVKAYVNEAIKPYCRDSYGENSSRAAYDRRMLTKIKNELESASKEPVRVYGEPLEKVRFSLMQLTSPIDTHISRIDEYLKSRVRDKSAKTLSLIRSFYNSNSTVLGDYADMVFESPAFME
jgi:hypothetical protein